MNSYVTLFEMRDRGLHILVHGLVQGVGFRYYTKKKADELGVQGHVQNLEDGTVEIHVEGHADSLNAFLEWCHNGPTTARVQRLDYEVTQVRALRDFTIIR